MNPEDKVSNHFSKDGYEVVKINPSANTTTSTGKISNSSMPESVKAHIENTSEHPQKAVSNGLPDLCFYKRPSINRLIEKKEPAEVDFNKSHEAGSVKCNLKMELELELQDFLFVEVKSPSGNLSESQLEWIERHKDEFEILIAVVGRNGVSTLEVAEAGYDVESSLREIQSGMQQPESRFKDVSNVEAVEDSDVYGEFDPSVKGHVLVADTVEKILSESRDSFSSKELASEVTEFTSYSESTAHALLTQGKEWIVQNYEVETERRRQGSGGSPTIFWRLDS